MPVTRETGIQGAKVKIFANATSVVSATELEANINAWLSQNPNVVIFDLNYQFIVNDFAPLNYTHSVVVVYK